jgi:hypothetical protein
MTDDLPPPIEFAEDYANIARQEMSQPAVHRQNTAEPVGASCALLVREAGCVRRGWLRH